MTSPSQKNQWAELFDAARPLEERTALAFAADGPLARRQTNFTPREGQLAFAQAVAEAIQNKETLLAEAGTGTGKSFAYLVPALLSGSTVVISTAGKPLQDQLFNKDIPALSAALGVNVPTAVLKGRSNYVCPYRLERTESEGLLPERDSYRKLREIKRFAAISATGDRAELPTVPEDDPLWPLVTSTRENCLGKERCEHWENCFVRAAREKALKSQIVVVNHHLFLSSLALSEQQRMIGEQIFREIDARLGFLVNVGLDYLTLSRAAATLSGGEAQRIRLATQIGSGLVGVLYILDEPSIGLHQRDNARLLATLQGMRDLGNTLIVVEHDEDTIRAADYIVDIGPGAGEHGGHVVAKGTLEDIMQTPESITGQFLTGVQRIEVPQTRRDCGGKYLRVRGARANNLKNIDVDIPLGIFTCVTGVSGSGKSSLVNEIVKKTLLRELNGARTRSLDYDEILGIEHLDKIIDIDQSPIGRTPRSNPATYTGLFDLIREVYAQTPDARMRGYNNGRFSFNVKGGRCEACRGDGIIKIEMHFLPDIYVPCEVCRGKRYNRETLEVRYKGKSIADVLDMTVEEALEFFAPLPRLAKKLQTLYDVGLGYVRLGQPSTTLSGGEAQRVKLATELSRKDTGRTLYVLDEPTTGLHVADVKRLLEILQRLCEGGSSVLVIEHNLDVIKTADYIIDLGPEGGNRGGTVVATGTPEEVAAVAGSYTGQYLKPILERAGEERIKE